MNGGHCTIITYILQDGRRAGWYNVASSVVIVACEIATNTPNMVVVSSCSSQGQARGAARQRATSVRDVTSIE